MQIYSSYSYDSARSPKEVRYQKVIADTPQEETLLERLDSESSQNLSKEKSSPSHLGQFLDVFV